MIKVSTKTQLEIDQEIQTVKENTHLVKASKVLQYCSHVLPVRVHQVT